MGAESGAEALKTFALDTFLRAPAAQSRYNPLMRHLSAIVPLFLCWPALQAAGAEPQPIDFGRDVRPILERSCWKCHGPDKQKGGLRFDRRQGAVAAGDSGKKAILPGGPTTAS